MLPHEPPLTGNRGIYWKFSRLDRLHRFLSSGCTKFGNSPVLGLFLVESRDRKLQQFLMDVTLTEQTR